MLQIFAGVKLFEFTSLRHLLLVLLVIYSLLTLYSLFLFILFAFVPLLSSVPDFLGPFFCNHPMVFITWATRLASLS